VDKQHKIGYYSTVVKRVSFENTELACTKVFIVLLHSADNEC